MTNQNLDDEVNPLQAEILREVEEEMQQEKLKKLWKKVAPIVVSLAVLALAITGGIEYYKYYHQQQSLKAVNEMQTALSMLSSGKLDEGMALLEKIKNSSARGYHAMASLHYAKALVQQKKIDEAIKALDELSKDSKVPNALKTMAKLDKVSLAIDNDNPDYDALRLELEPVVNSNTAWSADALELTALIYLRQNNVEMAKASFEKIVSSTKISETKKLRANEYLNLLNKQVASK
ncbi:MAG: tetratricopeptide repeat protein [Alphaproteobacteria bacterium]|nr:tetratricopeptide repeat protein [Alphaproteobacteria bacterium]